MTALGTRAVLGDLKRLAGQEWPTCRHCGQHIKFSPPAALQSLRRRGLPAHTHRAICNVYENGRWDRVEQFHHECYLDAGQPHGPIQETE